MAQAPSSKKVANSLVAVGAAAVMAVYAAGYSKTRSAADRFDAQSAGRRPVAPDSVPPASAAPAADTAAVPDAPPELAASTPRPQVASTSIPARAPSSIPVAATAAPTEAAAATPVAPSAPAEITPAAAPVMVASALPPAAAVAPPAPVPAPAPAAEPAPAPKWKDGTYTGWGSCRHGDIQAQVVIEGGRIKGATIAQCLTRYDCNVIGRLPPEVAQRQSAEVDYVSGATQSADAFYYAVLDALSKAK
jgi:uncharacterized protein with FMN-binding domain